MNRAVVLRVSLMIAGLLVGVGLFLALSVRKDDYDGALEKTGETTSQVETSQALYGAAAQFPQGTNPPVGVERTDAISSDARIFLEEARRDGETVTAFGRFTGGVPECVLRGGSGEEYEGEMDIAGDTFLFTAAAEDANGDYSVRCTIANRFFTDGPPVEELSVE